MKKDLKKLLCLLLTAVMLFAFSACSNTSSTSAPPTTSQSGTTTPNNSGNSNTPFTPNPSLAGMANLSTNKSIYAPGEGIEITIEVISPEAFPAGYNVDIADAMERSHNNILDNQGRAAITETDYAYTETFIAPNKAGDYEIRLYASDWNGRSAETYAAVILITVEMPENTNTPNVSANPFLMAFENRTVYLRMPRPEQDMEIRFGDFSLAIRTNQGNTSGHYSGFDEGIIFDLMYTYLNAQAMIEPVIGWERIWGYDNVFIKINVPDKMQDKLSDGTDDIVVDWSKVGNPYPITLIVGSDGQFNGSQTNFENNDVVVQFSELHAQYEDAWIESRFDAAVEGGYYIRENPLPERGSIFNLPADFGFETCEADKAYFFQYSDDYIVTKYDLRNIYEDITTPGNMYQAYNFGIDPTGYVENPDPDISYFQMTKFVFQDHATALEFIRQYYSRALKDREMFGSIENFTLVNQDGMDNVIYAVAVQPPIEGESYRTVRRLVGSAGYYATDDIAWLISTPELEILHPAAVYYPGGTAIQYYSKEIAYKAWEQGTSDGIIIDGQFYASKP